MIDRSTLRIAPCSARAHRARRAASRGMTLIEIMIVMVILAAVMGGVVLGSGQLGTARLKHAASSLAGGVRVGFTRATATSRSMRLVFDFESNAMWLEEGDAPMLVQSKGTGGSGGADPATVAEQQALAEAKSIVQGPKIARAHFRAVDGVRLSGDVAPAAAPAIPAPEGSAPPPPPSGGKGPSMLPRGITFREVQTGHDEAPVTSGRAYLYFWPGGLTERASIQLRKGASTEDGDTLSLIVSPLTGKVTVKNGPVALVVPKDDKESSEREDTGF
jgi:general secretion pathway protein H